MADAYITGMTAAASLTGDELLEVAQLSAAVTITASTISALASDNSYNDSGSGFVAAGFSVDDRVRVQGFTGNAANNILVGTITALTTGKMTIGGADGNVIVDDAAGESVTISKWGTRRAAVDDVGGVGGGGGDLLAANNLSDVDDVPTARANLAISATVATDSTTNYDVATADEGKYIRLTNAGAKTVTVRPNSTHALPANGEWHFRNVGAGDATVTEGSGVTVNEPADGTLVIPQGGTVTLKRVATDEFDLFGVTVAV